MDDRPFTTFGPSHGVAVVATAAAAVFMIRLNRSLAVRKHTKHTANVTLAVIVMAGVVMDPLCKWLRYSSDPDYAAQQVREHSLPLHLCDVVSFVLAWALIRRSRCCAELGYLWGLAGTLQGLVTPAVMHDWPALEYFGFFAQHGGVVVAALTLAFGAGLSPQPGALRRTMLWSWTYMAGVSVLNWLLGTNYGYFNGPPEVPTLIDYLGPWPWYLLSLQVVALLLFSLLLLPFWIRKREL